MDARGCYEAKKAEHARRAQERQPKPFWWLGQQDPITRYTLWLAIYTFLLFLGTVGSALILWKTDSTLADTMVNGQRAYLGLSTTYGIKAGNGSIKLLIENNGLTPAKDVKIFTNWAFEPVGKGLPADFGFPEKTGCGEGKKSVATIFPNNPLRTSHKVCGDDLVGVTLAEGGSQTAYLYGEITYRDIFDQPRVTTFCFRYGGRVGQPTSGSVLCARHNEIDPKR